MQNETMGDTSPQKEWLLMCTLMPMCATGEDVQKEELSHMVGSNAN
jgi:hypothetical protein